MASPCSDQQPRSTHPSTGSGRARMVSLSNHAIAGFCAVSVVIVGCAVLLARQPADRARAETLARRAGERLQALQREAERLASQESSLLTDLRKLEVERQIKAEEVKGLGADAGRGGGELAGTNPREA